MQPYYHDDYVTLYHGDCRDIAPTLGRFDLLLTDPPYGIKRDGKPQSTSSHGGHKGYDFKGWDEGAPDKATFGLLLSCARDYVIWGANYFAPHMQAGSGWLIWDKGQRIDQADGELAASSRKGPLRIFTLNRVALLQDGAVHPTQKPLALISWCMGFFPEAVTVFDPYAGSGTAGVASKRLGRHCTMIEREEQYCELIVKRMAQEPLLLGV